MKTISFDLAGLYYRSDSAKFEASCLEIGDQVKLKFDITNDYDLFAVKILSNGKFIGFVESAYSRDVALFLFRNKTYKAVVYYKNTVDNSIFRDEDLILSFDLYSENENIINFSDDWYKNKNILIDGIFEMLKKSDIEYFINKNGGILQKRISKATDAIVVGNHHISEIRIRAVYDSLKTFKPIIIISEEEMVMHFEGKF